MSVFLFFIKSYQLVVETEKQSSCIHVQYLTYMYVLWNLFEIKCITVIETVGLSQYRY